MPAVESSGTQTTVANTDHTLASPTTAKTRVLTLDASALLTTATLEVTISQPVLSGGTSRVAYRATFTGFSVKEEPVVVSVPVPMSFGGSFVIRCSVAISIPWRVETLD